MLSLRLASAAVGAPLLLGIAYLGGPVYGLALTFGCGIGAWEAREMVRAVGREPLDPVLLGLAAFLPFHAWFLVSRVEGLPLFGTDGMAILGVAIVGSLLLPLLRHQLDGVLPDWALSLSLGLYIGGLMQFFAPLRDRPDGAYWAVSTVGLAFVSDSSAYFAGTLLGRHALARDISPTKTWEGAFGALLGSALVGATWAVLTAKPVWLLAGFGVAMAVASIVGDLVESLLKRQTGVKDSGAIVPGHGGLLDRMDSLMFCAPTAVLYLWVFAPWVPRP